MSELKVTGTDHERKHRGESGYQGRYSIAQSIYQDDGNVVNNGFAIDKENGEN